MYNVEDMSQNYGFQVLMISVLSSEMPKVNFDGLEQMHEVSETISCVVKQPGAVSIKLF